MSEPTGLPIALTRHIRDLLNIKTFIETGTGLGRTTSIASQMFDSVYTIEAHRGRWEQAMKRLMYTSVVCILGESPAALATMLGYLGLGQFVIFLDAHCGYRELCAPTACPLLAEIEAAVMSNPQHVIIVDDEHAFTSVPPNREHRDHYPELVQVLGALCALSDPYVFIEGKAIVSVPREIKSEVDEFLYQQRYGE